VNWAKGVDRQRPVLNWNGGDTEKSVVYQNLLECAGSTILVIFHVRVLTKSELASGYFESLIRAQRRARLLNVSSQSQRSSGRSLSQEQVIYQDENSAMHLSVLISSRGFALFISYASKGSVSTDDVPLLQRERVHITVFYSGRGDIDHTLTKVSRESTW